MDRTAGAGLCAPPPFLMKAALPIGLNLDIEPLQRRGRLGVSKGGDSLCWDWCLYKKRKRYRISMYGREGHSKDIDHLQAKERPPEKPNLLGL